MIVSMFGPEGSIWVSKRGLDTAITVPGLSSPHLAPAIGVDPDRDDDRDRDDAMVLADLHVGGVHLRYRS